MEPLASERDVIPAIFHGRGLHRWRRRGGPLQVPPVADNRPFFACLALLAGQVDGHESIVSVLAGTVPIRDQCHLQILAFFGDVDPVRLDRNRDELDAFLGGEWTRSSDSEEVDFYALHGGIW